MKQSMIYKQLLKTTGLLLVLISAQHLQAQMTPLVVGNIQPGDSVVIVYDVTINTPIPGGVTQISNQGSMSGANFTTIPTNDPKTPAANDATITMLNAFPLPVKLMAFNARKNNSRIDLDWRIAEESGIIKYEVERSADGRSFTKIGEVAAHNTLSADYAFSDGSPFAGFNYYRLRIVDSNGPGKYSLIVLVNMNGSGQSLVLYPNPVVNQSFALQLTNVPKDHYRLELYNSAGKLVATQQLNHDGGSATKSVFIGKMAAGIYHIRITGDKLTFTKTVVME